MTIDPYLGYSPEVVNIIKQIEKEADKNSSLSHLIPNDDDLIIVSCGIGVDSVGLLVEMYNRGIIPNVILFAHVGDEWPETYLYIPHLQNWLKNVGFPQITFVRYRPQRFKHGFYSTLFGNLMQNHTVASIAFGRKGCSMKWKGAIMDAWVKKAFRGYMSDGNKPIRYIGYDSGTKDRKRCGGVASKVDEDFIWQYPLIEWGITRDDLYQIIMDAGMIVPHKSACTYCAVTTIQENVQLKVDHPPLFAKSLLVEDNALPFLTVLGGILGFPNKKRSGNLRQLSQTAEFLELEEKYKQTKIN